jgi:hypothetical protein
LSAIFQQYAFAHRHATLDRQVCDQISKYDSKAIVPEYTLSSDEFSAARISVYGSPELFTVPLFKNGFLIGYAWMIVFAPARLVTRPGPVRAHFCESGELGGLKCAGRYDIVFYSDASATLRAAFLISAHTRN